MNKPLIFGLLVLILLFSSGCLPQKGLDRDPNGSYTCGGWFQQKCKIEEQMYSGYLQRAIFSDEFKGLGLYEPDSELKIIDEVTGNVQYLKTLRKYSLCRTWSNYTTYCLDEVLTFKAPSCSFLYVESKEKMYCLTEEMYEEKTNSSINKERWTPKQYENLIIYKEFVNVREIVEHCNCGVKLKFLYGFIDDLVYEKNIKGFEENYFISLPTAGYGLKIDHCDYEIEEDLKLPNEFNCSDSRYVQHLKEENPHREPFDKCFWVHNTQLEEFNINCLDYSYTTVNKWIEVRE